MTWQFQFHAHPSPKQYLTLSRCVTAYVEGGAGLGASPSVSVEGGTPNSARQPHQLCPVLRRALCSGARASCVLFAWVPLRVACALWRKSTRPLPGWQAPRTPLGGTRGTRRRRSARRGASSRGAYQKEGDGWDSCVLAWHLQSSPAPKPPTVAMRLTTLGNPPSRLRRVSSWATHTKAVATSCPAAEKTCRHRLVSPEASPFLPPGSQRRQRRPTMPLPGWRQCYANTVFTLHARTVRRTWRLAVAQRRCLLLPHCRQPPCRALRPRYRRGEAPCPYPPSTWMTISANCRGRWRTSCLAP